MSVSASLLAIDSSTERLALAVSAHARTVTSNHAGGALASARIVPLAMALLADAGATLARLDAIAFARGPGAFTGLRTACAVAQGLAFGADRPVLALDSLVIVADDAHAQAGSPDPFDLWVAMDARMGEVYAAHYRFADADWTTLRPPALYELDALHDRWRQTQPLAVAGSALAAFADRLKPGDALRFPHEHARPAALMRVAQAAWRRGETIDAAEALPLYLRDKVALTTAERADRLAEKSA